VADQSARASLRRPGGSQDWGADQPAARRSRRVVHPARDQHDRPVAGSRAAEGFFRSVDYSDRTRYRRPPTTYLRLQWLGHLLTSWAIVPKNVVNLDVPGRWSGVIRRTTLLRVEHAGEYFLVALAAESEWVRNVGAAAGRVVVDRRTRHGATLIEVPLRDRAPVIRA
jgi:F420H(2)-dependent quinone reductase